MLRFFVVVAGGRSEVVQPVRSARRSARAGRRRCSPRPGRPAWCRGSGRCRRPVRAARPGPPVPVLRPPRRRSSPWYRQSKRLLTEVDPSAARARAALRAHGRADSTPMTSQASPHWTCSLYRRASLVIWRRGRDVGERRSGIAVLGQVSKRQNADQLSVPDYGQSTDAVLAHHLSRRVHAISRLERSRDPSYRRRRPSSTEAPGPRRSPGRRCHGP